MILLFDNKPQKPGVVMRACNPSSQKWRQESCVFETSLGHIVRPYLSKTNQKAKTEGQPGLRTEFSVRLGCTMRPWLKKKNSNNLKVHTLLSGGYNLTIWLVTSRTSGKCFSWPQCAAFESLYYHGGKRKCTLDISAVCVVPL
jgi:hypothetical protein